MFDTDKKPAMGATDRDNVEAGGYADLRRYSFVIGENGSLALFYPLAQREIDFLWEKPRSTE